MIIPVLQRSKLRLREIRESPEAIVAARSGTARILAQSYLTFQWKGQAQLPGSSLQLKLKKHKKALKELSCPT